MTTCERPPVWTTWPDGFGPGRVGMVVSRREVECADHGEPYARRTDDSQGWRAPIWVAPRCRGFALDAAIARSLAGRCNPWPAALPDCELGRAL